MKIDSTMETHEIKLNAYNDASINNRDSDMNEINKIYRIAGSDIENQKRMSMKKLDCETILIDMNQVKNDGSTPIHKRIEEEEYEELDKTEGEFTIEQKQHEVQHNLMNLIQNSHQKLYGDYDVETLSENDYQIEKYNKNSTLNLDAKVAIEELDEKNRKSFMNQVNYEI